MTLHKDRWVNRRRMAWLALWSSILFPLLALITDVSTIAVPFYLFTTGVVSAYIGFATVDDKWNKNENNPT